jgi:hypothetical protein
LLRDAIHSEKVTIASSRHTNFTQELAFRAIASGPEPPSFWILAETPSLIASVLACHASQLAYEDRHGGITLELSLLDAGVAAVDIYESTAALRKELGVGC